MLWKQSRFLGNKSGLTLLLIDIIPSCRSVWLRNLHQTLLQSDWRLLTQRSRNRSRIRSGLLCPNRSASSSRSRFIQGHQEMKWDQKRNKSLQRGSQAARSRLQLSHRRTSCICKIHSKHSCSWSKRHSLMMISGRLTKGLTSMEALDMSRCKLVRPK